MYGSYFLPDIKDFKDSSKNVEDPRNYFKVEKISGKERHEVASTRETLVKGNDVYEIDGGRTEKIVGASAISVGANMSIIVGGAFTENVTEEKHETYGNRVTAITKGSSELTIKGPSGSITETITFKGDRKTKVNIGNISDIIIKGNRSIGIVVGDFSADTKKGNMKLRTLSGQVSLGTKMGKAEIGATLNIDVKTLPVSKVNVTGGSINLKGKTGLMGGVITSRTHLDYTTGAPLKGSLSVKASV
jgi:hypothetical protein